MGKGHGLHKANAGIMKADAVTDYNVVMLVCQAIGQPIVIPKGQSAWKIEDATAEMLKSIPAGTKLVLVKGISYYMSLNK